MALFYDGYIPYGSPYGYGYPEPYGPYGYNGYGGFWLALAVVLLILLLIFGGYYYYQYYL
ncbi:sporulation protein YjcZ [Salinibacillus xinjiangensis]|uniref:Sporulation protein YjcZ n=1 Tax=Salinibacillus xinjiangensis TaxID=1229268 RepID=A0A6G1X6V7_9BACI|nr:sporulation protein YjcZ [Salinibacillus xinjiangensis]